MTADGRKNNSKETTENSGGLYDSEAVSGKIFRRTFVQVITVLVIILLAYLAGKMIHILLLFFAGIMLAVLINLFAGLLERVPRMPHWLAITIVLLIMTMLAGVFVVMVGPMVSREMGELASQLEKSIEKLVDWLEESPQGSFLLDLISNMEDLTENGELWARVSGIFTATYSAVVDIGIILITGVFLAYNPGMYKSGFLHLVPPHQRKRAVEVMSELGTTLRWWLMGQLISMVVLGVTTWIMLSLLNVPLAPILALITGLLTFIPYLGPLIALVPILMLAFMQDPMIALYVFILYMIIQNLEANLLMPIIFYRTVHIPPALGVISQIFFGTLLGVLGFILAIPLMAVVLKFIQMVYVEDVLGDRDSNADPEKIE